MSHPLWYPNVHYDVRFEVFTAVNIKITFFLYVTPCCLADMYQRFEETFCPFSSLPYITATFSPRGLFLYREQGSSEFLRNAGTYLQNYIGPCRDAFESNLSRHLDKENGKAIPVTDR
jgi:hypothetical protein